LFPSQIRRGIAAMIGSPTTSQGHGFLRKLAKIAELIALEPARRYARWFGQFALYERQSLYTEEFKCAVNGSIAEDLFVDIFAESDAANSVDADLSTDVNLYLPDDLLVKMDRASMAHSLEARSPLLDHVFMEFVATLPPEMKLSGNRRKHIFKQSLRGALPDVVLDRPKMGFGAPISSWFRNELREMAEDLLLSSRARQRGYFHANVIDELWAEHVSNQRDHSEKLWDLLVLELWHRIFLDGDRFTGTTGQASVACD
jgi:asparagine synthase (glutamine-hydrolysing)